MLHRRAFIALGGTLTALSVPLMLAAPASAQSGQPIRIGFSMALTGGLAPNGKSALLAQQIWAEDVNAKGGLLGRPVKLLYYDDQTNPATVPGIYTKLIDVDKVELIIGGYGTNMLAPAMPVVMQKNKVFIGLLGLGVNTEFNYPRFFVMMPSGPDPKPAFTKGFIDAAMTQDPKPRTVAIVAADAEFAVNASDGARENAKKHNLNVVYDKRYPPNTTDFAPIVRAIQATNPDLVVVCSYPPDSVGIVRAVNEIGFKPKMIGGAMVGLQNTAIKAQLGPLLNGWTNYDFWLPVPKMNFPGIAEVMAKYQARAGRRRRPARLLHGAAGLRADAGAPAGGRGDQGFRRRQARRLHPHLDLQDRARRREVRRQGRVGGSRACCRCSSRTSRATAPSSSRTCRPRSWCRRRSTSRASWCIRTRRRRVILLNGLPGTGMSGRAKTISRHGADARRRGGMLTAPDRTS